MSKIKPVGETALTEVTEVRARYRSERGAVASALRGPETLNSPIPGSAENLGESDWGPTNQVGRAPQVDRSYRFRLLGLDVGTLVVVSGLAWASGWSPSAVVAAGLLVLVAFRAMALYAVPAPSTKALDQVTRIGFATAAAALMGAALTHQDAGHALDYALVATLTLVPARGLGYSIERRRAAMHPRGVVIVGTGPAAQEVADRLARHPEHGMRPIGFVSDNPGPIDPDLQLPLLGPTRILPRLAEVYGVARVIVDTESCDESAMRQVLRQASASGAEVTVLPALAGHISTAVSVEDVAGMTLLSYRPSRLAGLNWLIKRTIDMAIAALGLLLTAPLFAVLAISIKAESRGPVLFSQDRVGRHGRRFRMLKLRTMVWDAETRLSEVAHLNECEGPYFKVSADPRITRVGRYLRRWSVDELPQLLNVLRGEMSIVGPRPCLPVELDSCPDWFRHRLDVLPGLTGLWQVSGRFQLPFHEASRLDVFYVDHWSLAQDIKILLRTPGVVLSGRGAR